jgi:hypothetical protein
LRVEIEFDLGKGPAEGSIFGGLRAAGTAFGPTVRVRRAHIVLGDMPPGKDVSGPLALEVSQRVVQRAARALLARHDALGRWQTLDADASVKVSNVRLLLDRDALLIRLDAQVFRAVTGPDSGILIDCPDLTTRLGVWRLDDDPAAVWRIHGSLDGRFTRHDGVLGLANLAIGAHVALNRKSLSRNLTDAVLRG